MFGWYNRSYGADHVGLAARVIFLFSDESGNLQGPAENYFVLSCIATKDPKPLRGAMRRTRSAKLSPEDKANASEIKASQATDKFKASLYRRLSRLDVDLFCLYLRVGHIPSELRDESGLVFLRLTEELLKLAGIEKYRQVYFHKDRRTLKGLTQREYDTALRATFVPRFAEPTRLEIYHQASHEDSGIQCADFVSHAFYRKHQHGDGQWWDTIRHLVAEEVDAVDVL